MRLRYMESLQTRQKQAHFDSAQFAATCNVADYIAEKNET